MKSKLSCHSLYIGNAGSSCTAPKLHRAVASTTSITIQILLFTHLVVLDIQFVHCNKSLCFLIAINHREHHRVPTSAAKC